MLTRWTATASLIALTMACGSDGASVPERVLMGAPTAAYGDDTTRLTVTVSPPGGSYYLSAPGWYNVTATVSGGNGTYKYFWKSRWCTTSPKECSSSYWTFSTNDSLSSTVSYYATQYDFQAWIVVQVQETAGNGRTGTDSVRFTGPADYPEPPSPPGNSMLCQTGSLGWPHTDSLGTFRRDPCTWAKVRPPN
jgi:hypothetical protein